VIFMGVPPVCHHRHEQEPHWEVAPYHGGVTLYCQAFFHVALPPCLYTNGPQGIPCRGHCGRLYAVMAQVRITTCSLRKATGWSRNW
jgi:hypothetical protein